MGMQDKDEKKVDLETPEWDISDLYSGAEDPRIKQDLADLKVRAEEFEKKYRGRIKDTSISAVFLAEALSESESIYQDLSRTSLFVGLLFASDMNDEKANALNSAFEDKASQISNHLIFFRTELFSFSEEKVDDLSAHPKLANFKHFLKVLMADKPFHLSEAEERILLEKNTTSQGALGELFEKVPTKTEFTVKLSGKTKKLGLSEILHLLYSPSRETRKEAARSITAGFKKSGWLYVDLMNHLINDKRVEDRLRKHNYPEEARHLANEISKEAVEALV